MAPTNPGVLSYDPRIFEHRGSLRVHAVFPHTWHLRSESGRILSLVASRWNGPLTMRITAIPARHRVFPGMHATLTAAGLEIGTTDISFTGARPWSAPQGGFAALDLRSLRADHEYIRGKGQAAARGGLAIGAVGRWWGDAHPHPRPFSRGAGEGGRIPDTYVGWAGFGGAVAKSPMRSDATDAWLIWGAAEMALLREALIRQDAAAVSRHTIGLLGLGPGLTPSGDDVLCGVIAGLSVLGRRSVRHRERCEAAVAGLAACIAREASRRTTSLSVTLLQCAVRGVVAEPLLHVLGTVGSGNQVKGVDEVLMLGHSSGSDMLTGALMACAVLVRWEELFGPAMVGSR